jgi:hypothetical protein
VINPPQGVIKPMAVLTEALLYSFILRGMVFTLFGGNPIIGSNFGRNPLIGL